MGLIQTPVDYTLGLFIGQIKKVLCFVGFPIEKWVDQDPFREVNFGNPMDI